MTELINKLKQKDEWALKEVMRMYKGQIFNYLLLMLGNREQAEELTQDTFVRVYFKAGSLKTENLKAWIYKIATNLALSEFRKRGSRTCSHLVMSMNLIIPMSRSSERI